MGGPSKMQRLLRSRIQAEILECMNAAERNGADYTACAIEAVAVLAEEQAVLLGCIADDDYRAAMAHELANRIPPAAEEAHARALRDPKRVVAGTIQ